MSVPYGWRIDEIQRKAEQAVDRLYEIDALRRDVAGVERAIGEVCACIDGLRATAEATLQRVQNLEDRIQRLEDAAND